MKVQPASDQTQPNINSAPAQNEQKEGYETTHVLPMDEQKKWETSTCLAAQSQWYTEFVFQEFHTETPTCIGSYQEQYDGVNYGKITLQYPALVLTVETQPPEIIIYTFDFQQAKSPSLEWFITRRDEIVPPDYKMNWDEDLNPDETEMEYSSSLTGFNVFVHLLISDGNIMRMMISYA